MSVSLLYRDGKNTSRGGIGKDTPDRLALRRLIDGLRLSKADADYFLRTLSAPLVQAEDITYRREILRDFSANPPLLGELDGVLDRLSKLRADHAELKREKRAILRSSRGEAVPDTAKNLLQTAGLTLKRCLLLLDTAGRILASCTLASEGLRRLRAELETVTSEETYSALLRLCTRMEQYSEVSGTALRLRLSEQGAIVACDLTDRQRIAFRPPTAKKKRFLFAPKDTAAIPSASVDLRSCLLQNDLRVAAIQSLADLADELTAALFDRFLTAGRELSFYRSALRYAAWLEEKGAPTSFAEVGGQTLAFEKLYDPLLLQTVELDQMTPNDLAPAETSGIVIVGENGSGKTVWLRSVGVMQIFTQAGLPVSAESACIPLYRQILTHFSSGEKEFEVGNEAGRFEQEVRELASVLDEIGTGGLILFNETFQTTAYKEGSEGLSHILRYLADSGNRWMLTTHLTDLPSRFADGEIMLLQTDADHRVRPKL
ncbi:MAG: hypothetical protein IJX47_08980 [Clostridia bacterium]|nr:hypothetical protein [Clostridia bacterium]